MSMSLPAFPPAREGLETPAVLRALVAAYRYLAKLKGVARAIPNQGHLLSTLTLREAQSRSEIENIVTTQEALLRQRLQPERADTSSKEVTRYVEAMGLWFAEVKRSPLRNERTGAFSTLGISSWRGSWTCRAST